MQPLKCARLAILAACSTFILKLAGFWLTNSLGLLSDCLETLLNLATSIFLFYSLHIALRPPDQKHRYGHGKAEYFTSLLEGLLIIAAGLAIVFAALSRFSHPVELQKVIPGMAFVLLATLINFLTARILTNAGRTLDSIALEAEAKHLLTDVYSSLGVLLGLCIIFFLPAWTILDPIMALVISVGIFKSGLELIKRSFSGLMDSGLSREDLEHISQAILDKAGQKARYHALKTRSSGRQKYIELHLLLPGQSSVQQAHDLCCQIEEAILAKIPQAQITIHIEPLEDKRAWEK